VSNVQVASCFYDDSSIPGMSIGNHMLATLRTLAVTFAKLNFYQTIHDNCHRITTATAPTT